MDNENYVNCYEQLLGTKFSSTLEKLRKTVDDLNETINRNGMLSEFDYATIIRLHNGYPIKCAFGELEFGHDDNNEPVFSLNKCPENVVKTAKVDYILSYNSISGEYA